MINSVQFKSFEDERGSLHPFNLNSIPFIVKRIFIVTNVPKNEIRGSHAHFNTKQLLVCINGTVDVILHDGKNEQIFRLEKNDSILIPELVWDSQKFTSENSEILVFCSTEYEINNYILNFDYFKELKNKND